MKATTRLFLVSAATLALCAQSALGYRLTNRWSMTASGPTGASGTSATLTWGFVPDGTTVPSDLSGAMGTSGLIDWLDTLYGAGPGGADLTQRPWFNLFEDSFGRWGQLVGVEYIYEPNDDGAVHAASSPGVLGVRADMRIGGTFVDGGSNTLAFNFFPNRGDMIIDTGDSIFYSSPAQNFRRMRNVLMHEHGHGGGMFHVESVSSRFLMEPTINTAFDGPQLDDIRGMQRHYGDFYEKSNGGAGNNTAANATSLGLVSDGNTVSIGTDATNAVVLPTATDFVSINVATDVDYFSFSVDAPSTIDALLTPLGPSYFEGPQGGAQSSLDSAAVSDLTLAIVAADGMTELGLANATGLGEAESLVGISLPTAGTYYARITGTTNVTQMYQLDLTATTVPEPLGGYAAWLALLLGIGSRRRFERPAA